MSRIRYAAQWYPLEPQESVLEGLLRQGVSVPHACKAGVCQSCLVRAVSGAVPAQAQVGLKETLKARNYFLACSCRPEPGSELELSGGAEELQVPARLESLELLSEEVLRVRLRPEAPFDYRAGQYLTLLRGDGLARSYSLASLPGEEALELHVRLLPGGAMSGWLGTQARPGDTVRIQGPVGECFYVPGQPEQPLLLAGTGTGLAPLYGVVRDALAEGHTGPIWLFHGARERSGLYLIEALRELAARHPNLHYRPSVLEGRLGEGIAVGELDTLIRAECPKPAGWRAFLCGNPERVISLRKKLFLAGLSLKAIHADAFLPSARPPEGLGATARASDASR
ncbi:2Fe-2S iron-sulfur cluster-binding protein [Hyalangium minutum]|uniref:2-polyprenylphenol hydroxylase n=1 Tax=Hyalangium minutum TaxID=394096 RepID=A0A085W3R3_9BACT|nr:2Fe-2S iron-sulfur cluster-binding protein [Hyalangium minutum]KFE62326.1 2-polyprenylphenol hydroxylase [Hyalangium minutum]